jgi:hypothetical protein
LANLIYQLSYRGVWNDFAKKRLSFKICFRSAESIAGLRSAIGATSMGLTRKALSDCPSPEFAVTFILHQ